MIIKIIHKKPKYKKLIHELRRSNEYLLLIIKQQNTMANQFDEINAKFDELAASLDNIAADINKLVSDQADGLSAEQATAISNRVSAIAATAKSTSDIVPDAPVEPPVEPPTEGEQPTS